MGIKIVRTPSETPNITNVDDIIPFRYAYGNQNGYVIGRGSQLDGSYESGEFTVGSGRAVIQGVEVDIDANGISTTLGTASETRYFKIYLKVNLANDVAVLESYYSTVSYNEITDPTSSDLISGGDAYLLLYTLQLSGTTQVEKEKIVKQIEYISFNNDDYVVSKKKLLWSGRVNIGSKTETIKITDIDRSTFIQKTIEIVVEQGSNGTRFYKFKFGENGFFNFTDEVRLGGTSNLTLVLYQTNFGISYINNNWCISGQSYSRTCVLQNMNTNDSFVNTYVTKIYEIIE